MQGRGCWVALALLSAHGCSSEDVFACTESSQCESVGVAGTCEPSGFCSFPDPECDSGRRYGGLAGPLSNTCVSADDDDTVGATSTSAATDTSFSGGTTLPELTTTTGSSGGGETDALTSGTVTGATTTSTAEDGSSSSGAVVPEFGLVGWWRFNDPPGDGVLDASGKGLDAVCVDACPELDKADGYYRFSGAEMLRIPGDAFGAGIFTVSVWTRPNATTTELDPVVFTKPVGALQWNSWGLHYDQVLAEFEFVIGNAGMNTQVQVMDVETDGWHHFAGRFDGSNAALFIDGVEVVSGVIPGGFFAVDDSDVYIGGDFDFAGPPDPRFRGDLDDVRYYNVALTDEEIAALATAPR
ncbi:MAG: LamG domain-containing protein [Myxococcota bacterium]